MVEFDGSDKDTHNPEADHVYRAPRVGIYRVKIGDAPEVEVEALSEGDAIAKATRGEGRKA